MSLPSATSTAPAAAGAPAADAPRPSRRGPVVMTVLTALGLLAFVLLADGGTTTLSLASARDVVALPDLVLPSRGAALVLLVGCAAVAALAWARAVGGRRTPSWVVPVFGALFVLAFLVWVVTGARVSLVSLLGGTLLLGAPLVFGAMAGVVSERAGVVNIAIEGQLLLGAFLGAVVASLSGTAYLGLVAAPVGGVLVGMLLAVFTIRYLVNQIIVGVVLNVLVIGLTSFLYSTVLSDNSGWNSPTGLPALPVPGLSQVPVVGPVLFNQNLLVYLMYVVVAVLHVMLFRSRWGLRLRAVGEHPKAADTVGIPVQRTRFRAVVLGGAIAGLGGASFTLGASAAGLAFNREMTAGSGYIALAAMIFGRWSPLGALGAALLFGFASNLQNVLSVIGTPIPSQFLLMAPYLATIFAVAGLVGRVRGPAAAGTPYEK
ncbi:ABC transporter permease [Pseudokineococcus lusitanus]|uniref:Nucleoside ABC transporter membrane protein n=1 Tax=Pseudokineococcus lusitanus TaxID=763993 RepID=A0A3N1HL96_9ACTN|nr:ABC transporter permease [Pseudokineococcus lusitanus]ROP43112.1 nucleoside ABC transporter membrane protein [Pseudokineococcus lusitanus]